METTFNIRSVPDGPILLWCLSDLLRYMVAKSSVAKIAQEIDARDKVGVVLDKDAFMQYESDCVPTGVALVICAAFHKSDLSKEAADFMKKKQSEWLIARSN